MSPAASDQNDALYYKRLYEEELRKRLEEQQERLKERERTRNTTLPEFLLCRHVLVHSRCRPITEATGNTGGVVTKPEGCWHPTHLAKDLDFESGQQGVWKRVLNKPDFTSSQLFDPRIVLENLANKVEPISSEQDLLHYTKTHVEQPAMEVAQAIYNDPELRAALRLRGLPFWTNHKTFGTGDEAKGNKPTPITKQKVLFPNKHPRHVGSADQYCVYPAPGRLMHSHAFVVEYKPPHKLTIPQILIGLRDPIDFQKDIFGVQEETTEYHLRRLVAAVIVQCFDYMIANGTRYGYVSTGEAYIFLSLLDKSSTLYYHVCIPREDVEKAHESAKPYLSAVAQVSAFILRTIAEKPPSGNSTSSAMTKFGIWKVEFMDILQQIPETVRKTHEHTPYEPTNFKGLTAEEMASRPQTRQYKPPTNTKKRHARSKTKNSYSQMKNRRKRGDEDGDDEGDGRSSHSSPTPTPNANNAPESHGRQRQGRTGNAKKRKTNSNCDLLDQGSLDRDSLDRYSDDSYSDDSDSDDSYSLDPRPPAQRIFNRPYCSSTCMRGLLVDAPLDSNCPNFKAHVESHPLASRPCRSTHRRAPLKHMRLGPFLKSVLQQVYVDNDYDADCVPTDLKGSRGRLWKIRHARGYTFVAKAVMLDDYKNLERECHMYQRAKALQGITLPVCLGVRALKYPQLVGEFYTYMLFLSWGGISLDKVLTRENWEEWYKRACDVLWPLNQLGIRHGDAAPRNFFWDRETDQLVLGDLERAKVSKDDVRGLERDKNPLYKLESQRMRYEFDLWPPDF